MLILMDDGKKTTKVLCVVVLRQKSRWRSWHRSIVCPGHSEGCSPPFDPFYQKNCLDGPIYFFCRIARYHCGDRSHPYCDRIVHGGGSSFESNKSLRLTCPRDFGELYCRAFVTVDPSLAFATVMPVKSRASIDSQFLAANGRIVTLLGNLGKDAWVRTVNIDRNSLQT